MRQTKSALNTQMDRRSQERRILLKGITERYMTEVVGVRGRFLSSVATPPPEFINAELERLGTAWRVTRTARGEVVFHEL